MSMTTDRIHDSRSSRERGAALITALLVTVLITALLAAYFILTRTEMATTRHSMNGTRGFYAAEAGLNLRASAIRSSFVGYERPTGTPPTLSSGQVPCVSGAQGSGDFACQQRSFSDRNVHTFVIEDAANPSNINIPPGEPFQNLSALEYQYSLNSVAVGSEGRPEAILEMGLKSRLVPLFQFAAFYDKDLEILPGQPMTLEGPVHTNGSLYLDTDETLDILGQVTTAGDLYRGRKNEDTCDSGAVSVIDPATLRAIGCGAGRTLIPEASLPPWNGYLRVRVDQIEVPEPEVLDPVVGEAYWDLADLRVMLDLDGTPAVEVRNADGSVDATATGKLATCGSAGYSNSLYNNREGTSIRMLDVDVESLLDCIHASTLVPGLGVDDTTQGGLVWYLGVEGPDAGVVNDYGVRLRNATRLDATATGAPPVAGLTVVTNQAAYTWGDFNKDVKKPASILADSLNILSVDWLDGDGLQDLDDTSRRAGATTVHAAFLAGTDVTGGLEGIPGQDQDNYNGGLENYPRLHENWSGVTLTYRGSFVSLGVPRSVDGAWGGPNQYKAPIRDWRYETDFNDAAKLPPLTPRFVYLRQNLYSRRFTY